MLPEDVTTPERGVGREVRADDDPAAASEPGWRRDPIAWLIVGLGVFVLFYALWWALRLGDASVSNRFTYVATIPGGLLVVAICVRVWRSRAIDPQARLMWSVIGAAVVCFAAGALLHVATIFQPSLSGMSPLALVLEMAAYPIVWVALTLVPGPANSLYDRVLFILDIGIVAICAGIILWHFVLYPVGRAAGGDFIATLGPAILTVDDLCLVFALGALYPRTEWVGIQRAFGIAAVAVLILFAGDMVAGIEGLRGVYSPGGLSGLFYSVAMVGFAAAVYAQWLIPNRRRSTPGLAGYSRSIPWPAYVAVAVAFVAPTIKDWNDLDLLRQHLPATGILIAFVGTRLGVTVRENARLATAERTRLAAAVSQAAEAMLTTDQAGNVTYVNPAFTRITGYTPAETVGRFPDFARLEPDTMSVDELQRAVLRGEGWAGRMIVTKGDGTEVDIAATIAPVRDSTGTVSGAIAVGRDDSRERALEARLAQAQRMEAVGRLAGGIAHDFNNILTAISGFSELAAGGVPIDDPVAADLREITKAADRAAQLTRALLAFGRRLVLTPRRVDLNEVVSGLTPMLGVLLGEDITLDVKGDPELGMVLIDRAELEQVVLNLAVNARDAMPAGGTLTISTANTEIDAAYARAHLGVVPGPHVKLVVSDTGVGMTPEVMEHAFEPFFTTKARGKGTGLGLSTVIGVVAASMGTVDVVSESGAGSVFTILLPRVDGASDVEEPAQLANPAPGRAETILVAEDEEAVRAFVERVLARAGYRVVTAANGQAALEAARTIAHIDLLFTDMVMPGMGGPELAKALLALHPAVRIIYGSGYSDDALEQDFGSDGRVPYLSKPFTSDALLARVRQVLDGPRSDGSAAPDSAKPRARRRRPGGS